MTAPRGQSSLADIRLRVADRLSALSFLRESPRAFSLSEVPTGIAHGAYYVTVPGGMSLGTWKVRDANGFDWQSTVETTIAYRLGPHRSVKDHDEALRWAHRVVIQLVRQTEDWPVDLRVKGDDVTVTVQPDSSGNYELITVTALVRHNLSLTEAA